MKQMKIKILGTAYTVIEASEYEDAKLNYCDGYCDKTTHVIAVSTKAANCDLGDFESYRKKVLRHEIIHAYLFESGLHENFEHAQGHDETYVDWIAVQFPKILSTFQKVGCL